MDKQTALDVAVDSEDPSDDVIKYLKLQFSQKGIYRIYSGMRLWLKV